MSSARHVTILIVDDDEGHTELICRNFRRTGIDNPIESVTSGSEALEYVFRRGAHANRKEDTELLILLDIRMPGSHDGVEVLRRLKSDPQAKTIPVIMLTTTDDPREVERCYELGCNVYITKPIESGAFIEAIRRVGLMISIMSVPTERSRPA
ncbi:MAG TPA: response regulator [Myxococcaceae bacterium]|nr:response regulator [Myxococcaceae bacterium]